MFLISAAGLTGANVAPERWSRKAQSRSSPVGAYIKRPLSKRAMPIVLAISMVGAVALASNGVVKEASCTAANSSAMGLKALALAVKTTAV